MFYEIKHILHYAFLALVTSSSLLIGYCYVIGSFELSFFRVGQWITVGIFLFGALVYYHFTAGASDKRVTKGTKLVTPKAFTKLIQGDGLGIPYFHRLYKSQSLGFLRIRTHDEAMHVLICGDSGSGKSALQHSFMLEIRSRNKDLGIVYDPSIEFWEHHARENDILLHPLFTHCPYWDIADEIRSPLDAAALAESFLPDTDAGRQDFWDYAPRQILEFLLLKLAQEGLGIEDLVEWLCDRELITDFVEGTELESHVDREAGGQRAGVFASLNRISGALRLLPPNDGRPSFSFARWAEERPGWIFIGTRGAGERKALRPLISAWLDTAFARLMTAKGSYPTWFFVDELPSLQRLPSLQVALQEGRKYNLRFVLGFQGRSQLEQLYKREAESLMSAPSTRIFLRTNEFMAAEWAAKNIGYPEQEQKVRAYTSPVLADGRDSVNIRTETQANFLILPNEIQILDKLSGVLRYDRYAVKIQFPYPRLIKRNAFTVGKTRA